ncbi:MAG: gliding motility-associated C-terminal domain-containing protein, partial [Bacteroidota bacterium]
MDKFLPVLFLLTIAISSVTAQNEANIWYFGHNAGLDFNGGDPVPLTDGVLNTDEGCASIADEDGVLLFYTDGTFVWNKEHEQMPNGEGMLGHKSSTQSGVIVPKPGDPDVYYIFTVDFTANPGGIAYSEVDMTLDGGLGDVTTKNVQLITPACEKITAVQHANQQDIWVVGHAWESDQYLAWLVTPAGVNTSAVISSVGSYIGDSDFNTIGYLKASAEGNRIAAAHWYDINQVEIFDFNNETGVLSNPIYLDGFTGNGCYGVEFAPSEPILYVSERTYGGYLYQYDLSSNDQIAINNSKLEIAFFTGRWGALQLGPDGKMYVSKRNSEYLGIINKPDILGAGCEYVDEGIYLDGQLSWIGLPSFIQSYFVLANFSYEGICPDNPTVFTLEVADSAVDSLLWNFGDPASGAANFSTELDPTHTFSDSGTFEVTLIVFNDGLSDTNIQEIILEYPSIDLGMDVTSCPDVINTLDASASNGDYLWSDGSTDPTLDVTDAGTYWIEVMLDGCPATDTIEVIHLPAPNVDLGMDPTICEDTTYTFNGTTANADEYDWSNGSPDPIITVATPGNYALTVTSVNGCTASDEALLTVNPLPVFSLGADQELCEGDTYTLDVGLGNNSTYLWQDNSTSPNYIVTQGGTYVVTVTTDGCSSQDVVEIFSTTLPEVNLGEDTLICIGEQIDYDVYWDELTTYAWQNNSNLPTFSVTQPGIYSVELTNVCGTVGDEIIVDENVPPVPLFIGNDTTLCIGDSFMIDATNFNTTHYLWHDGSNEPTITVQDPGYYAVTWANNCGFVTEVIEVENRRCECPVIYPNAFSPNGDGWNEKFNTVSPCAFYDYNLKIFSRWGELLFETNDPSIDAGWDGTLNGKDVGEGVYVFIVEFEHEFDRGRVTGDVT